MMHQPVRVLVVDDEKLIRWSVSERLTRSGYEVVSADTGEKALEAVAARPPDLMLLDVRLPGVDGVSVLGRALGMAPEMAVLMMSAHSTVDIAVDAMKRGATDFLVKPFPLQALDAAIERALTNRRLRRQIEVLTAERRGGESALDNMVGRSAAIEQLRTLAARVASSDATTVLIDGESGAGKEVVARAIHFESARADRPFLQLNCAALPEHLVESELFGHERGAFTDAHAQKRGLFESADGGTVFLDELGDLPPGGQVKLLQLLENKTFRRVGGVGELRADVRVIAATNVDLEERVSAGRFRADLFFRLNVVRLRVPPLREHVDDVPLLSAHFIARFNREMKRQVKGIAPPALELLCRYRWPGNVRELRNAIERALILHPDIDELRPEHLPPQVTRSLSDPTVGVPGDGVAAANGGGAGMTLEAVERKLLGDALERAGGNQSKAARLLGITRDTLRYRMKKYSMG